MKLKVLLSVLLFLSVVPASYAGGDRLFLSLTPSLHGGVIGITDASRSSLTYNGPLAGAGLYLSACRKTVDLYLDADYSYGWLRNIYHNNSESTFNHLIDLSIGGMTGICDNNRVSMKVGCALGGLGNAFVNRRIDRCFHMLTIDAKACVSTRLKLPRKASFLIEDRIPLLAFMVAFNKTDIPLLDPDYAFKAFPGNDCKAKVCQQLRDGRSLMLVIRCCSYSSGRALPNSFQIQFLELGLALRFGLAVY